jgi:flagellar biosynthesis GTPase FlhF
VDPIPEDNECASQGECFLVARKAEGEWTVDSSQFKQKIVYSPIGEFADITEVLAAGELRILDSYRNFFAFYFESFIGIYSDDCCSLIRDPVGREIQTIERTYYGDGFLLNEEPTGPPREIVVERDYAASFERYFGTWKAWGVQQMLSSMMKSNPNQQLGRVCESTTRAAGFFTGNYNDLENAVSGKCRDDRIQTAYANMLNYAKGSTPITGKYATSKRPYEAPRQNQVSAPQTAKRLADEATARKANKSQAQLAAEARERERAEAHRKRIQEDIARRNAPRNAAPVPQSQADEQAAHQARVQTVQQQALEITKKTQALGQEFQNRMHAAKTPEERTALQQEFQQKQQEAMTEYQELLMQAQQQR